VALQCATNNDQGKRSTDCINPELCPLFMAEKQIVQFEDLGKIAYKPAWDYQADLFDEIVAIKLKNRDLPTEKQQPTRHYLLFCEHPHVYTLGKSGSMENLLLNEQQLEENHIEFYKNNRGGDITYHGPGQNVGYPILDLEMFYTDIHRYMRNLEEVFIKTLDVYGIKAGRYPGYTGVWLEPDHPTCARKICALGVKCSRWVTMHGWAFNINSDLQLFDNIVPCGITDKGVTSLQKELGVKMDFQEVKNVVKEKFGEVFECDFS
jgi:lipoyl(octanoyl) transferase